VCVYEGGLRDGRYALHTACRRAGVERMGVDAPCTVRGRNHRRVGGPEAWWVQCRGRWSGFGWSFDEAIRGLEVARGLGGYVSVWWVFRAWRGRAVREWDFRFPEALLWGRARTWIASSSQIDLRRSLLMRVHTRTDAVHGCNIYPDDRCFFAA
jgi:hypothetical protein